MGDGGRAVELTEAAPRGKGKNTTENCRQRGGIKAVVIVAAQTARLFWDGQSVKYVQPGCISRMVS